MLYPSGNCLLINLSELTVEFLNPTSSIHQHFLTSEERVRFVTDFQFV